MDLFYLLIRKMLWGGMISTENSGRDIISLNLNTTVKSIIICFSSSFSPWFPVTL